MGVVRHRQGAPRRARPSKAYGSGNGSAMGTREALHASPRVVSPQVPHWRFQRGLCAPNGTSTVPRLPVTHHADTTASPRRRALLDALAHARQQHDHLAIGGPRVLVAVCIAFVVLWFVAGFQLAITTTVALVVLWLVLVFNGKLSPRAVQGSPAAVATARQVELELLQHVADDVAPWMRVCHLSPIDADLVRRSGLVRSVVDHISGQRCLSGLLHDEAPFCITHIEAWRRIELRPYRKPMQRRDERVFRGLFAIVDCPGLQGWMTLHTTASSVLDDVVASVAPATADEHDIALGHDELAQRFTLRASSTADAQQLLSNAFISDLLAFCDAYPGQGLSLTMRDEAIAITIPIDESPFHLRQNADTWPEELHHFSATVRTLAALLHAVHPAPPSQLMEVA